MGEAKKRRHDDACLFDYIDDAVHENILRKLPAVSFAFAACVSKSWKQLCYYILFSRPKISSALSLRGLPSAALEEVVSKVLSQPIRPHFALAYVVGPSFDLNSSLNYLASEVGSEIPIIVTRCSGVMGRSIHSNKHWEYIGIDSLYEVCDIPSDCPCVLLVIGFLPSLKTSVIPFPKTTNLDDPSFLNDVKSFSSRVSGCPSPSFIMMFGHQSANLNPTMDVLDKEMSTETIVAGNESCEFIYRKGNEGQNSLPELTNNLDAVSLVFANDLRKPTDVGEVRFHGGFSSGIAPIGPLYRVVRARHVRRITSFTSRERGTDEVLSGDEIMSEIDDVIGFAVDLSDQRLYVGVTKKRNGHQLVAGSRSSVDFYGTVIGHDDERLDVKGPPVYAEDFFQFYFASSRHGLVTGKEVSDQFKLLKENWESEGVEFVGGFMFTSKLRGRFYFTRSNFDSTPFLGNFKNAQLAGVFCSGEIARGFSDKPFVNKFSALYVGLSYTPPPPSLK